MVTGVGRPRDRLKRVALCAARFLWAFRMGGRSQHLRPMARFLTEPEAK